MSSSNLSRHLMQSKQALTSCVLYVAAVTKKYDPISPTEGKMASVCGTVVIGIFSCLLVGIVLLDIFTMPKHIQLFRENIEMFRHSFVVQKMCQCCNRVSQCIADSQKSEDAGRTNGRVEIELKEGTDL